MKKGDHGSSDQKTFGTAFKQNGTRVYTLVEVSPTSETSCILEAGRRHSGQAGCGDLARTVLVAGCVLDRKTEIVAPPLVAIPVSYTHLTLPTKA